ncbi:MAG TPA: histidine triad nucleotide-binding protein, partial [Firmicutes bacterium]|nr:histidine triad nucleotide-binding protein [Bacillota bacterium]
MSDCVFCQIVSREIPAQILLETEEVLAFKDASPVAPLHILLIPKQH